MYLPEEYSRSSKVIPRLLGRGPSHGPERFHIRKMTSLARPHSSIVGRPRTSSPRVARGATRRSFVTFSAGMKRCGSTQKQRMRKRIQDVVRRYTDRPAPTKDRLAGARPELDEAWPRRLKPRLTLNPQARFQGPGAHVRFGRQVTLKQPGSNTGAAPVAGRGRTHKITRVAGPTPGPSTAGDVCQRGRCRRLCIQELAPLALWPQRTPRHTREQN